VPLCRGHHQGEFRGSSGGVQGEFRDNPPQHKREACLEIGREQWITPDRVLERTIRIAGRASGRLRRNLDEMKHVITAAEQAPKVA
jgi:hypothetical protein